VADTELLQLEIL